MTRLAIVIVSYNCKVDLDRCLSAIPAAAPRTSHQIVVVDNASRDGTAEWVRQRWAHVTLIEAGMNIGFSRANNLGIRRSASELVLLLNPDTVPGPDRIDCLVETIDARPDVGAVGPRLLDPAGRAELSFGRMIGLAPPLVARMFEGFERQIGLPVDSFAAQHHAPRMAAPALVVHDLEDDDVPWEEGERYARLWPDARLLTTTGLGHHRIAGDATVIEATLRFLSGEAVGEGFGCLGEGGTQRADNGGREGLVEHGAAARVQGRVGFQDHRGAAQRRVGAVVADAHTAGGVPRGQ